MTFCRELFKSWSRLTISCTMASILCSWPTERGDSQSAGNASFSAVDMFSNWWFIDGYIRRGQYRESFQAHRQGLRAGDRPLLHPNQPNSARKSSVNFTNDSRIGAARIVARGYQIDDIY